VKPLKNGGAGEILHSYFKKKEHFMENLKACRAKVSKTAREEGTNHIFTTAFLEQMRNIMENLLNTKVFKRSKKIPG